ncbi:MAG: hypothetical protein IPM79_22040 [Polyangiaceae bacterium]|nr:hypothetical protein [Polyangiaceae bacterium]MBK8940226.1 hypothetical protein [Polyangiaceae bacterium]
MPTLDDIVDHIVADAGADFAFVLTRRGRLVTRKAPQDMPAQGRDKIVAFAEMLLADKRPMAHLELPREDLVPFGGAAPIDVYVAAREEAIVCVVMATFVQHNRVGAAVAHAVAEIDALIEAEGQKRLRRRGLKAKPPNPKSSQGSSVPPARGSNRRRAGGVSLDFDDDRPARMGTVPFLAPYRPTPRPPEPPPDISISEANVGRMTLAAIEIDADGPEISYGVAPLGRNTIAEIELSLVPRGLPGSSAPDVRVSLASMPELDRDQLDVVDRQTLPFTEQADAAKRAFEARLKTSETPTTLEASRQRMVIVGKSSGAGRSSKKPRDEASKEADRASLLDADTIPDMIVPEGLRETPLEDGARGALARGGRDSNIDAWHQALDAVVAEPGRPSPPAPEPDAKRKAKRKTQFPPKY